jgi:ribosomal protein S18 acetylase RimI-like enzyme
VRARTAVGFVSVEEGAVRGFVLGSVHPKSLKREVLRRNAVATVAALALGIIKRPSSMVWLLRSLRGPDEGTYDGQAAELIYLAVDAERRTSGVGKSLVQAFTRAMRESGVSSFELSVDEDNQAAIRFYEAQRFQMIGRYREFGALHRRYKLEWT